ncbi:ABC transporter substrate-binding protein [Paenibacillus radicis (ex Gao et al. 2016)]|uniref:ABC transporter substrate-binding protein n=1 Tax=Paenibacillus radicis (ex Gao et al. 2016) TaxID=1737354 RepID=A0A917LV43_9BACL|nr:ABC transporter substrate-binding protein [Paenibacillus radicis (ex Gao et al. 2016)]GGG59981.1 ABC transporter substrate-binding protein [Paenibacillus radicis (ex Gao et al. 2016)]
MHTVRKIVVTIAATALTAAMLAACGTKANGGVNTGSSATIEPSASQTEAATRSVVDSKGHTVEIPTHPQKVVYTGSDLGDVLALGIKPVGADLEVIASQVVFPDLLTGIEDVGEAATNPEKILALEPDLIFMDSGSTLYEPKDYDVLNKIAPTVTYDRLTTFERLLAIGDLLGKKQEAEQWINDFKGKAEEVKKQLDVKEGETAAVFIRLGKQFYVMGDSGFANILYDTLGYAPTPKIQKELIDTNERFTDISNEVLPEYSGDYLFILTDDDEAARAASESFTQDKVFKSIEAVANKRVYYIETKWNFDDPVTKDRLLDELPKILN